MIYYLIIGTAAFLSFWMGFILSGLFTSRRIKYLEDILTKQNTEKPKKLDTGEKDRLRIAAEASALAAVNAGIKINDLDIASYSLYNSAMDFDRSIGLDYTKSFADELERNSLTVHTYKAMLIDYLQNTLKEESKA